MGMAFIGGDERGFGIGSGDSCTMVFMCLMPLNCTCANG